MENVLAELQTVATTAAAAAVTALVIYAFSWLRTFLGIVESDSNEEAIRRAAVTEAGRLTLKGLANDPQAVLEATEKVLTDLRPQVSTEGYTGEDVRDMILGAAGAVFPPANLLKLLK